MKYVVAIAPGHGGKDSGACRNGITEKAIALDMSLRLRHQLHLLTKTGDMASGSHVLAKLTREKDEYVNPTAAGILANGWNASLLVTIHVNSAWPNVAARGVEALVSWEGRYVKQSTEIGGRMLKALELMGWKNRGVRPGRKPWIRFNRLAILATVDHKMPAVLLELGFASNKADAERLKSNQHREKMARAMALAICGYLRIDPRLDL